MACETTCPSGVRYARLVELARPMVETKVGRRPWERLKRWLIRYIVPYQRRFAFVYGCRREFLNRCIRARCGELVPGAAADVAEPQMAAHSRKMVLLDGCAQAAVAPSINAAACDIFDQLDVQLLSFPESGCCGAVPYHLGEVAETQCLARRNIDTWWAAVEAGAEAVVATSTACAMMLKEYGDLLAEDPEYAERARRLAGLVRDPCEVIDRRNSAATIGEFGSAGCVPCAVYDATRPACRGTRRGVFA